MWTVSLLAMLTSRLGVFVRRVSGPQFRAILENLCVSVLSAEDEQRDIASLALRTAMAQVAADDALAEETARTVVPALAAQVRSLAASVAQQNDALDILADALEYFAATVTTDAELHTVVLEALLAALESRHSSVSRRAVNVLALFATECQPDAYETILGRGLAPLQAGAPWQRSRTAVQLCGLLARDTPRRLRSEAPRLVDAMLHIAQAAQAAQGEEADNVLESALQSIGLVLAHCVPASGMNVGGALECALALLQYDPNYAGYEEDDMDEEEDEEEDEEDEDEDRQEAPKRRTSRAAPRAKRARTDEPAEEPEAAATTAAVREQEEELDPATRKVREWRHKLQRAFLSKAGVIVAEDMDAQDATFKTVEAYQDMTVDQLKATKIGKVMKRIYQLPDIPRDDEFHFRDRAGELMKRWSALIGSHAPSEDNDA